MLHRRTFSPGYHWRTKKREWPTEKVNRFVNWGGAAQDCTEWMQRLKTPNSIIGLYIPIVAASKGMFIPSHWDFQACPPKHFPPNTTLTFCQFQDPLWQFLNEWAKKSHLFIFVYLDLQENLRFSGVFWNVWIGRLPDKYVSKIMETILSRLLV